MYTSGLIYIYIYLDFSGSHSCSSPPKGTSAADVKRCRRVPPTLGAGSGGGAASGGSAAA
eukprot:791020-Prorocentrum_minimum.AAC.2